MTDVPILRPTAPRGREESAFEDEGERRILVDARGGFTALRETLAREFGTECQAEMFYRAGSEAFRPLFERIPCPPHPSAGWLESALALVAQCGYGNLTVAEADLGSGWLVAESGTMAEAGAALETGERHGPACDYARGVLRGLVRDYPALWPQDSVGLEAVEVECRANGAARCRFAVGAREALAARGWRVGPPGVSSVRDTLQRLSRQIEEVLEAAQRDALTGLYNRAHFDAALHKRIDYAARSTDVFSIALIDVDRFKEVNDSLGHAQGDLALQRIAAIFQSLGRATDLIARYGGDEFAWILPGTAQAAALRVADRIRGRIAVEEISPIPLTLSIGVAACPADGVELAALIHRADKALYAVKARGGNGVCAAPVEDLPHAA